MPAYNHERFVGEALKSVLQQTHSDFELVVVDDGSTDGTAAVIKSFNDPRIKYFHQENQDAYNALNKGMSLARGEWFSILNSDDCYCSERLAICLKACQAGADAVFTGVTAIDESGQPISTMNNFWYEWHNRNLGHYRATGDLYAAFLRGNLMISTSNLFMSAAAARAVGDFAPLRYLHDYDYIFRLLLAFPNRVKYLEDASLLKYRIHGSNTLKQGAITAREQDIEIIRKYTLLGLPESGRVRAQTGLDRLAELYRELTIVQSRLRWGRWAPIIERLMKMMGMDGRGRNEGGK
jgi:glycosyltransferase involved in cell wall biosynthesis